MSAVVAARLTERQLLGIDCARCGAYLGVHALPLGQVEDRGYLLQLFGCDPLCNTPPPLPRRDPGRSWRAAWGTDPQAPARPVPHTPAAPEPSVWPAGVPPWRGTLLDRDPLDPGATAGQLRRRDRHDGTVGGRPPRPGPPDLGRLTVPRTSMPDIPRDEALRRYREGRSMASLARRYGVSANWLAARFRPPS
ncbi:hypothetical protein [Streptomyces sp. B6B3]|uniref:hypothetical protein n=1 Tax=Streptomyces sp. B6B3 TaxID=3153570 RepID=UPI00325C7C9E